MNQLLARVGQDNRSLYKGSSILQFVLPLTFAAISFLFTAVAIPETQYKELVLRRLQFGSSPAEHCVMSAVQGLTLQSLSVLCSVVPE